MTSWAGDPARAADAAGGFTQAETRADQQFATYGFAHELGSGVYDLAGRTLQVYTLPFAWTFREAGQDGPGLRLRLPVTLGFLDFRTSDVVNIGLPDSVDSVSFVPGVEGEIAMGPHWVLRPYIQAGASRGDDPDVDALLYGAGARAEREFTLSRHAAGYASELIYSGARYAGDLPDDDLLRWRNGVELRAGTGHFVGGREMEVAWFGFADWYPDPPTGPKTQVDAPPVQLEAGVMLGLRPMPRVLRVSMPRLGLSYRYAGDLSTVRLVIGAPF